MEITYQPIEQQDVEKIFAYLKELVLRYEDLGQIDCEKVLAWSRRKIEQQMADYRKIFCDGCHAGYVATHDEGDRLEIDDLYLASARQCFARWSHRPCRRTRPLTSTSLSATRARCASTAGWALRWCRRFQTPAISWSTAASCQERKEKTPPQSGEAFCVGFTGCSICPCTVPSGRAPKRTPASL